ncbi:MAG: PH domain-containing protein [Clostridia bacterium]|nr:PH domain-containing protein [Clostridia bacterium]
MIKTTLNAHPITIFFLLRRWWFAFTTPIVRMLLQYIISKKAQRVLLSEVVLLVIAVVLSVVSWLFTKVMVTGDSVTIKKGIFLKRCITIDIEQIFGVTIHKNFFYWLLGCVRCVFHTTAEDNNSCKMYLKKGDIEKLNGVIGDNTKPDSLKRQNKLKRFLSIPVILLLSIILVFSIRVLFFGAFAGIEKYITIALCLLACFYGIGRYCDYRLGRLCIGECIYANSAFMLGTKSIYCNKNKLGIIKLSQNPLDCRHNTCKIKITSYGESGQNIKIKHIECDSAKKCIKTLLK